MAQVIPISIALTRNVEPETSPFICPDVSNNAETAGPSNQIKVRPFHGLAVLDPE